MFRELSSFPAFQTSLPLVSSQPRRLYRKCREPASSNACTHSHFLSWTPVPFLSESKIALQQPPPPGSLPDCPHPMAAVSLTALCPAQEAYACAHVTMHLLTREQAARERATPASIRVIALPDHGGQKHSLSGTVSPNHRGPVPVTARSATMAHSPLPPPSSAPYLQPGFPACLSRA